MTFKIPTKYKFFNILGASTTPQQQQQQRRSYQEINDFPTNHLKNGEIFPVMIHASAETQAKSSYEVWDYKI